ncbi:MAG TPA: alpha/beta family hydrolase [Terriglobales bacterium]|nr:alpha/beta family hydrolase [Terriglobales bacterium]
MHVVLGPGAMTRADSLAAHVAGLRARGIDAEAIDLPRGRAERAAPLFAALAGPDVVAGGHSFGGRAASLAAAEPHVEFAGLLLFGFPLSGRPDERTAHFSRIRCPVLVLNGEADELSPFAVLREKVALLPRGRLIGFPRQGHALKEAALEEALDIAARFVSSLEHAT